MIGDYSSFRCLNSLVSNSNWQFIKEGGGGIHQFVSGHRIKPRLSPQLHSSQVDLMIIGATTEEVSCCSVGATLFEPAHEPSCQSGDAWSELGNQIQLALQ